MLFISKKKMKKIKYILLLGFTLAALFGIFTQKDKILKYFYPLPYSEHVYKYSKEYNLDPYLVYAAIRVESNFESDAKSSKGAKGLMQITDDTGQWAANKMKIKNYNSEMLYQPQYNIMVGCWYIRNLIDQFDGNMTSALAAYNGGSGNVEKWLKNKEYSSDGEKLDKIPFGETKRYVEKIKKDYNIYKSLYER